MAPSVGGGPRPDRVEPAGDLGGDPAVPHRVEHVLELVLVLAVDGGELEDRRSASSQTFASKNHIDAVAGRRSRRARRRRPAPGRAGTGRRTARPARRRTASCLRCRACRRLRSIASSRSALTIDTSSMTRVSMVLSSLRSSAVCSMLVVGDDPDRQPEQRVDGLPADVERGDAGRARRSRAAWRCSRTGGSSSVDLPVPARPVTKMCSRVRLDRLEDRRLLGGELWLAQSTTPAWFRLPNLLRTTGTPAPTPAVCGFLGRP